MMLVDAELFLSDLCAGWDNFSEELEKLSPVEAWFTVVKAECSVILPKTADGDTDTMFARARALIALRNAVSEYVAGDISPELSRFEDASVSNVVIDSLNYLIDDREI